MLDINYVIWNVLPFTDAITFPNSQTDISIFEVVEATKMLNLIIQRAFFDSSRQMPTTEFWRYLLELS